MRKRPHKQQPLPAAKSVWIPVVQHRRSQKLTLNNNGSITSGRETFPQADGLLFADPPPAVQVFKQPGTGRKLFVYLPDGSVEIFRWKSLTGRPARWCQLHEATRLGKRHATSLVTLTEQGQIQVAVYFQLLC